jgi:hypothetical protein
VKSASRLFADTVRECLTRYGISVKLERACSSVFFHVKSVTAMEEQAAKCSVVTRMDSGGFF